MDDNIYFNNTYWFSRGYYDGRLLGYETNIDSLPFEYRQQYNQGYEVGEADYERLDKEQFQDW